MTIWQDLAQTIERAAQDLAHRVPVTVRTNLNASMPVHMTPFAPGDPVPNPLMMVLQPEVTVGLPTGPIVYAPYGVPTGDEWETLLTGAAMAAIAFMGLGALIRIPWFITLITGASAYGAYYKLSHTGAQVGHAL